MIKIIKIIKNERIAMKKISNIKENLLKSEFSKLI